jgi:hypothetical protein
VKVRVEKAGNRILVASDRPIALKSVIPGANLRKDKIWSLPLEFENCVLLRQQFGVRLEIGPILRDWAKAEKAQRVSLSRTAASLDADLKRLPEVAPKLAEAMASRTYQRSGVRFIADTLGRDGRRRALLADTVGLGKTAQALGAVLENGEPGPYLIICPKTAVNSTWSAEIKRWLPDDEVITVPESRARRVEILHALYRRTQTTLAGAERASLERSWVIMHPFAIRTQTEWICSICQVNTKYRAGVIDALDCGHPKDSRTKLEHQHTFPDLFKVAWGAVIVDESDQILIRKTGTPTLQRRGAEMLGDCVRPGGLRLAMSGTPFRSKPHQIWSTLNWLDPTRWSAKWRWVGKYWQTVDGVFGGTTIGAFKEEREEMLFGELSDVMLRRTRDQVRGDLPAKLYAGTPLIPSDETSPKGIWLPMAGPQLKMYKQMEETATASLAGGDVTAIGVLAELTRLKQFAGAEGVVDGRTGEFHPVAKGNKFEWLLGFLEELGFPDKPATKLVVASQFTRMLNAFRAGVEHHFKLDWSRTGAVTGEVTGPKREHFIECFEDGKDALDLLFINTKAGGSSITLDAAEAMVILDETWVDDEQEQLEGRIDNRNPEKRIVPRTYYYLRTLGSVEESIAISNAEAKRLGKKVLDGVTPADFGKQMMKR